MANNTHHGLPRYNPLASSAITPCVPLALGILSYLQPLPPNSHTGTHMLLCMLIPLLMLSPCCISLSVWKMPCWFFKFLPRDQVLRVVFGKPQSLRRNLSCSLWFLHMLLLLQILVHIVIINVSISFLAHECALLCVRGPCLFTCLPLEPNIVLGTIKMWNILPS